jgi:pyrimidine-nucleoside phosphorylase
VILPQELIRRKRDGEALTAAELQSFFYGYLEGRVADYQVGAMLMAILLKGMTDDETATLVRLMRDSGECFTWAGPERNVVDKHSTGGVGDKTSLLIVPLCLLEGLRVPMMAGRGLGHTGGTLDKLEAVGWDVFLPPDRVRRQMERLGGVIMGQTERVTPLDRKLYAMRDVTATVESMPLIVSSILSKKLAEGLDGLVMDVKYGSGAFMRDLASARALAVQLGRVGRTCGIQVRCLLTDMGSPLGRYAGNALEVLEAMEVLQGQGPVETRELTLELATEMVRLAYPARPAEAVKARLARALDDGSAHAKFLELAAAQGGDLSLLEHPESLARASLKVPVVLDTGREGRRVAAIDTRQLGIAILELGGGRRLVTDKIDPWVGLAGLKRVGELVQAGEPVAVVHGNSPVSAETARALVAGAYRLGDDVEVVPLIAARI